MGLNRREGAYLIFQVKVRTSESLGEFEIAWKWARVPISISRSPKLSLVFLTQKNVFS